MSHKSPKFKVADRVRIAKYKIFLAKVTPRICTPKLIFVFDYVLKTNPWTHKIKDLNGGRVIRSFYEKELLMSIL